MRMIAISLALAVALLAGGALAADIAGEVTDVDAGGGRVTLKHGPIKKLDMGAMTMGYRVSDPGLLKGIKAGDHVTFDVGGDAGDYTVTKLRKAK